MTMGDEQQGEAAAAPASVFRIAFVTGVTVTKWTKLWEERRPDVGLSVFNADDASVAWGSASTTTAPGRAEVILDDLADVAFVRLPIDRSGLSAITLYSEQPVVMVAREHAASAFDEIAAGDLADEHLLQHPDSVPEWRDVAHELADGSRRPLRGIQSTDDAVEQVAAGIGMLIMPQSIARMHTRKDVVYRPVVGVAPTEVALVWREGDASALVEEFIGIVRGRSANSSRTAAVDRDAGYAGGGRADGGGGRSGAGTADVGRDRTGGTGMAGGTGAAGGTGGAGAARASGDSRAAAGRPAKKLGPVAKAKAKARAAQEAEEAAGGAKKGPARPARKKQSDQANAAQARRRKFGGKR